MNPVILAGPFVATCPTHGEQHFARCEQCQWWYCPEHPCRSVIPDETITPDGGDVIQWSHEGTCNHLVVLP